MQHFEARLDIREQRFDAAQPLLGLLDLALPVVQPVGGVVYVAHQAQHVLEHGARLRDVLLRGRD